MNTKKSGSRVVVVVVVFKCLVVTADPVVRTTGRVLCFLLYLGEHWCGGGEDPHVSCGGNLHRRHVS